MKFWLEYDSSMKYSVSLIDVPNLPEIWILFVLTNIISSWCQPNTTQHNIL